MDDGVPTGPPMLSTEELARLKSIRFEENRREYATSRLLVRTALARLRQRSPETWRFTANAYGKPAVEPDCGVEFNVSNCVGLVVCLLAEGYAVGVDVEPHERAEQILDLSESVFSAAERAQLEALAPAERADRALSLWTLKEAYTKGLGRGLSVPLHGFSFLFGGPGELRLVSAEESRDRTGRWRFCLLDHAGHRIALAAACATSPALEAWELRPAEGTVLRLPQGPVRWLPVW